jgi:hypothetical protein
LDPVSYDVSSAAERPASSDAQRVDPSRLHNFDRTPQEVLSGARTNVTPEETATLGQLTGETLSRLESLKLVVATPSVP